MKFHMKRVRTSRNWRGQRLSLLLNFCWTRDLHRSQKINLFWHFTKALAGAGRWITHGVHSIGRFAQKIFAEDSQPVGSFIDRAGRVVCWLFPILEPRSRTPSRCDTVLAFC